MFRLSRKLWIAAALLIAVGCTRSFQTYDVAKLRTPVDRDYLYYALPRTVVTVDLPVTKIASAASDCTSSDFNDLRTGLGLPNPKAEDKEFKFGTSFKLGDPVVGKRSEPDPDAVYAIDLRMRAFALTSGAFELADNGVLTTESVTQEDHSVDTVLSVAKIALIATGNIAAVSAPQNVPQPTNPSQTPADLRAACVKAQTSILELRKNRITLITDSVRAQGASKEYLDAALGKLDDLEAPLTSLFTGDVTKTVKTIHCEVRPKAFDDAATRLVTFSAEAGVTPTDQGPCVVPLGLKLDVAEKPYDVVARVDRDGSQYAETIKKTQRPPDASARGFFYRVPGTAIVNITYGPTNTRAHELMNIAQLGTISTLPTIGGAFVRKAGMAPTLNANGGLTKLTVNGEPGGDAAIKSAGDLLTAVKAENDKNNAASAAATAASKDELAQLVRQRTILEEQEKIAELKKKLAAEPPQP